MKYTYKCPYCNSNNTKAPILDKCIIYIDDHTCRVSVDKRCNTCGKIYNVEMEYIRNWAL